MPHDLNQEDRHKFVRDNCNMKDRMYDFVWLIQKKQKGNPSWKCRGCMGEFVGGRSTGTTNTPMPR